MDLKSYLSSELGEASEEEIKRLSEIEYALEMQHSIVAGDDGDVLKEVRLSVRDFNEKFSRDYDRAQLCEDRLKNRTFFLGVVSILIRKEMSQTEKKKLIIDGGCSTGIDLGFLGMKNPHIGFVGYDISLPSVRQANERLKKLKVKNVDVIVADHDNLPFREETANLIYLQRSFGEEEKFVQDFYSRYDGHHTDRAKKFGSCLKKDGCMTFTYQNFGEMYPTAMARCFADGMANCSGLKREYVDMEDAEFFVMTFKKPR